MIGREPDISRAGCKIGKPASCGEELTSTQKMSSPVSAPPAGFNEKILTSYWDCQRRYAAHLARPLQFILINPLYFFRLDAKIFHGLPLGTMVEALHQYRQIGLEQWI